MQNFLSSEAQQLFADVPTIIQRSASDGGRIADQMNVFNTTSLKVPIIEPERLRRVLHLGIGRFGNVHQALLNTHIKVAVREEYNQQDAAEGSTNLRPEMPHISQAMALDHENFAWIYGITPICGQTWGVVMEYCEGGSLMNHLYNPDTMISHDALLSSITQVATAIQFAHANNMLLNELKTSNFHYVKPPDLANNRDTRLKLIDYWNSNCKPLQQQIRIALSFDLKLDFFISSHARLLQR